MHCRICFRTCYGEPRTRIEVCGQRYHAVRSSGTRTHAHEPTRRSTVHGCHGKNLRRGCGTVATRARDENRENYVWWRSRRQSYVWRNLSFVFRVCMGLVGSSLSERDPVVIYQFSRLCTPRARDKDFGQGPHLDPVFTRAFCVPRNREQEERPAGGIAKNADV